MSFDFPDNPVEGQLFRPEFGPLFTWYDGKWRDAIALGEPPQAPLPFKTATLLGAHPRMGGAEWDIVTEEDANLWKIGLYRAPTGVPIGPQHWISDTDIPRPGDTYRLKDGDILVNAALAAPALGRQWAQAPAGQFNHANTNLDNRVMTSSDGINWVGGMTPTDVSVQAWQSVCWSPDLNLFCAVASAGGTPTTARVMTSPDGFTWTIRTAAQPHAWQGVCWGGPATKRKFVAVSSTSSVNHIMTSADGITWATRATAGNSNALRAVCWSDELQLFVAVHSAGTGQRVVTSSDGEVWAAQTTPADNNWQAVCWAGPPLNLFVAVAASGNLGNSSRVMTSPNGTVWTQTPGDAAMNGAQLTGICWSPELRCLVACASGGANRAFRSTDAMTWTTPSGVNIQNRGVCWAKELGLFIMVANIGVLNDSRLNSSPDGTIWTARVNMPIYGEWFSVCWSPQLGRFVATSTVNSINAELLSWGGLNLDPIDWVRYIVDCTAANAISFQYNNPSRNISGSLFNVGVNFNRAMLLDEADAFGFYANTDKAGSIRTVGIAKEIGGHYAPQGQYDYALIPTDFRGLQGPPSLFPGVWIG